MLTWFVLWRTAFGLRLRACGERPEAAESLGVNVYTMKYVAVVVSGALAGLGGAFLAIVAASAYREGQTGGRGFIGIAAMIFGNWRPGGTAAGAGAVRLRRRPAAAARRRVGARAAAARRRWCSSRSRVWLIVRGSRRGGIVGLLVAPWPSLVWFAATDLVPGELDRPHAVRRHAARARRSPPSGCGRPRPTASPTGRGHVST